MRFVVKKESDKTEKLKSSDTYLALLDIVVNKDKSKISDSIYRDAYTTSEGMRSKVEDQLVIAYKHKCAYCERVCKADIEHYRPKKGVKEDKKHNGYYWLCYEWTNLIPACITCNREGAKHTQFPLVDPKKRIYDPPPLLSSGKLNLKNFKAYNNFLKNENPKLLHPEIDNPKNFFKFDLDYSIDKESGEKRLNGIRIIGIDTLGKGDTTVKICKLNRNELIIDRQNIVDEFAYAVKKIFDKLSEGDLSVEKFETILNHEIDKLFENSSNEEKSHTLLRKYIVKNKINFKKIVIPFLGTKYMTIILEAFKNRLYKNTSK